MLINILKRRIQREARIDDSGEREEGSGRSHAPKGESRWHPAHWWVEDQLQRGHTHFIL